MSNENENILIDKACEIISFNLGEMTAVYYREFYKNKSPDIILSSLEELLLELVGPKIAKEKIGEMKAILINNKK